MIAELREITSLIQVSFLALGIVFLRIGSAFAVLPLFGERSIPPRIRLVAAGLLAVLVWPSITTSIPSSVSPGQFVHILLAEVIIGLTLGIGLRLLVNGLQVAGTIAAQSTSLSQLFGGSAVDPQPAVGHVLLVAGLALLVTMGFHVKLVGYLVYSYSIFPVGEFPKPADMAAAGTSHVARVFALGFSVAAPFVIAASIYNIALGAINRAMPQLMVSFVGAPAITAAGLIVLALAAPMMLSFWVAAVERFLMSPFAG